MLRIAPLAVAAVAAAVAASTPADGARLATPPFSECAVTFTTSAGSVTQLVSTKVWLSNQYIGSLRAVRRGDAVCTDGSGQLSWRLAVSGSKTVSCQTSPKASLRLFPPSYPSQAVRFRRGTSVCSANGAGAVQFGAGATTVLRLADPVLVVEADPDEGTTVKLVTGFAEISGRSGGRSTIVAGSGQQTFVPVDGDPESPTAMHLDPGEKAAADRLRKAGPQPSWRRPAAGRSKTLGALYARGVLRVALDADELDEATAAFAKRYFVAQAVSWGLKLELSTLPGAEALKALAAGSLDAVVSPKDAADTPALAATPFVLPSDSSTTWQLVLPEDAAYVGGMTGYLQTALFFGRYGDTYRTAYSGAEAAYDRLAPVLP